MMIWPEKTALSETHAARDVERGTLLSRFVSFRSVSQ